MKISIVMPSYNQDKFVEAAILSVLNQDYKNKEILFVDGGSNDRTMEIVEKYRDELDFIVSEKDEGQSDALHKGFSNATGDILTWLNTDDLLLPGALKEVADAFNKNPRRSWLLGNVVWIDADDKVLSCWRGERYLAGAMKFGLFSAGGPASFFKRDLYEKVGGIKLDLHYQMDTDLWWRFAMTGTSFHRLRRYIWALRLHEDAKVSGHMFTDPLDEKQIKVAAAKHEEKQKILAITASFRKYQCFAITPVLSILRKFFSFRYLRGFFESRYYKGKALQELLSSV